MPWSSRGRRIHPPPNPLPQREGGQLLACSRTRAILWRIMGAAESAGEPVRSAGTVRATSMRDRSERSMTTSHIACSAALVVACGGAALGQGVPVAPPPVLQTTPAGPVPPIVRSPMDAGPDGSNLKLTPVEQGLADVDALARGLRRVDPGLREPQGFELLYLVPGRSDLYMRVDNGLYAVFPRSVYANFKGKAVPLVPNDTKFYIGQSGIESLGATAAAPPTCVSNDDRRVDPRIDSYVRPVIRSATAGLAEDRRVSGRSGPPAIVSIGSRLASPDPEMNSADAMTAGSVNHLPSQSVVTDPRYRADRVRALLLRAVRAEAALKPVAVSHSPDDVAADSAPQKK
jgi:hypothetical protein